MQIQQTFLKDIHLKKPYAYGPYNKIRGSKQAIRITEGCTNNCPHCYEPTIIKIFPIPEIQKSHVLIYDMNLLCKPEALQIIKNLGEKRLKNYHKITYELVCGIDYRFLNQEIANELHKNKFVNIRLAWDTGYTQQIRIKKAIDMLLKAGYKNNQIMVFMVCNYKISYEEQNLKLDLCKVWRTKVCDCYFDGQLMPHVTPLYWTGKEIEQFRRKTRKHNQLVNFGIDPEIT